MNSIAKPYNKASLVNGRNDPQLADALTKVSPEAQTKTRAKAQEFEAMFLNSMFSQMTTGVKGDGPFGDTTGTGIKVSNLSYLPVNARVDREHETFALDTFIYGYDEIVGTGSFSEDTLTLKLHHKPASFAPAGRSAFDCTTVLVKN